MVVIAVRSGGLEAYGVSGGQWVLVESQCQLQLTANEIGVFGPAVPHQPLIGGRRASRLIGDKQKLHVMIRHLTQSFPSDSGFEGQQLPIIRRYVGTDTLRSVSTEIADARNAGSRSCRFLTIARVKQVLQLQAERRCDPVQGAY